MIVFDDADLEAVAAGIRDAGFYNSGQDCTAATRILAGPRVHDDLLSALEPAVKSIAFGDPLVDDDIEMGPLVSTAQQERVLGLPRARDGVRGRGRRGRRHRARTPAPSSSRRSSQASRRTARSSSARSSARS